MNTTYSLTFATYGSPPIGAGGAATGLEFDGPKRNAVADCIVEVCGWNGWPLSVVNVLPNEVHVLVSAERAPEYVMTELKAWATRRLREAGLVEPARPVWARNGSTEEVSGRDELARIVADVREADSDGIGLRFGN